MQWSNPARFLAEELTRNQNFLKDQPFKLDFDFVRDMLHPNGLLGQVRTPLTQTGAALRDPQVGETTPQYIAQPMILDYLPIHQAEAVTIRRPETGATPTIDWVADGATQAEGQFDTNNVPVNLKQFRKDAAITEAVIFSSPADAVDKLLQDLFAQARTGSWTWCCIWWAGCKYWSA